MNNDLKILHGTAEMAGQAYYSVKGLRDNGHKADLVLWNKSPFDYPVDKCLNLDLTKKYKYPISMLKIINNFCSV